jgi:muramidase (phage lysozyme)
MTRDELLSVSREPNVRAMLDVIAACEGTAGKDGYRTQFGGGTFESFADHPRQVIERTMGGKPIASSAAGRYQFLGRTWASVAEQYDLPSFEPQWQDAGAVALIIGRGALEDIRAGRLDAATAKLNREWASLPGAPYGQPTKHPSFVRDVYLRAGGRLDGGAPIEARTAPTPPAAPAATQEHRSMAPVLAALLPSIVALIPELGKLFGSGTEVADRNLKAAEKVAGILVQTTQTPNLQAAVEQIQSSPDSLVAARVAVQAAWYDFAEAGGGGIEGARAHNDAAMSGDGWRSIGYAAAIAVLAVMIVGGGGLMMWTLIRDPATPPDQRGMLIGAIVATISAVVAYFFGSSASSRSKDAALVRELGQR